MLGLDFWLVPGFLCGICHLSKFGYSPILWDFSLRNCIRFHSTTKVNTVAFLNWQVCLGDIATFLNRDLEETCIWFRECFLFCFQLVVEATSVN